MLLASACLSLACSLAPQVNPVIEAGVHDLTPGAALEWEELLDQPGPLTEVPQFLVESPTRWIEFVKVYDSAGVKDIVVARAFDRASGASLWSGTDLFAPGPSDVGEETLVALDAAADGGTAFLYGIRDGVAHAIALDTATGTVLWDVDGGAPDFAPLISVSSVAASPDGSFVALAGTASFNPYDPTVVVLSGADGSQLWSVQGAAFGSPDSPISASAATNTAVFVRVFESGLFSTTSTLFALDASNQGAILWESSLSGDGFHGLTANAAGTELAGVAFASQITFYGVEILWSEVNTWDIATGARTVHAFHEDQAVVGFEFDPSGDDLVAATMLSDDQGTLCAPITLWNHDLVAGALDWSSEIAPAFGACSTMRGKLEVVDGAAVLAVQSEDPVPGGRIEVHALDLATGGLLWQSVVPPQFNEHYNPLGQIAGDASSIAVTSLVRTSGADGGSTQLTTFATSGGGLSWTRVEGEEGPSADYSADLALAPDGATLYSLEHVNEQGVQLRALDAASGTTLWTKTLDVEAVNTFAGSAKFRGDLLVSPSGDRVFAHLRHFDTITLEANGRLIASSTVDGAELWQLDVSDIETGGFLRRSLAIDAAGTTLFVAGGDDLVQVQAVTTGGALLWDELVPFPAGGGGEVFDGARDLEYSDATGLVYVLSSFYEPGGFSSETDAFVAALVGTTGAPEWSRQLDPGFEIKYQEAGSLSVDPTGDRVVVIFEDDTNFSLPDVARVVALDAATGADRWSHALPGAGELNYAQVVAHALGGERAVVAGTGAIYDPDFRVAVTAFDPAGAIAWEMVLPNDFPLEVMRVLPNADGTAVGVVASLPWSLWMVPGYSEQGFVMHWLDAVDGTLLWTAAFSMPTESISTRTQIADAELGDGGLFIGGLHFDYPAGGTIDRYLARYALPTLTTSATELSVTLGGTIPLELRPGAPNEGDLYLVLGSITGTSPGIPIAPGVVLPLAFDAWTNLTLVHAGQPGLLPNTIGALDAYGRASAAYVGQQSGATSLVGLDLYHAFATLDLATGKIGNASNPVATRFVF